MAEVGELVNVVFGWRMKLELDDGKVRTFFLVYNIYIYTWNVDMNLNYGLLKCQG